ncbi:hypothetical protein [Pseudomonas sp. NFX98]|uniref:hypothetical protein n=1 Tax=Pseudomonas sp. NFX98 TaxID=3399122 RepID=UPI0039FCFE45
MSKECSVFVNGAAIVLVSTGYGGAKEKDLMNSILFAQLVANKRVIKNSATNWSTEYLGVLGDFWVRNFKVRHDISLEKNQLAAPVEWAAMAMANSDEGEVRALAESLEWIARLPCSSPELNMLRSKAQPASVGDEMLDPASLKAVRLLVILAQNPPSMTCLCLEFKTRKALEGNPWTQHFRAEDVDGPVSARYFRATLSETLYELYRNAIALKVRDRLSDNVVSLAKAVDISTVLAHGELDHE